MNENLRLEALRMADAHERGTTPARAPEAIVARAEAYLNFLDPSRLAHMKVDISPAAAEAIERALAEYRARGGASDVNDDDGLIEHVQDAWDVGPSYAIEKVAIWLADQPLASQLPNDIAPCLTQREHDVQLLWQAALRDES